MRGGCRCVGMTEAGPMLAEATNDGAIVLRPAAVYPIEIYSDERIAEFEQANAVSDAVLNKVRQRLDDRNA